MTKLISLTDLALAHDMTKALVASILKGANLNSVYRMPQGRGHVELYSEEYAAAAVEDYKKKVAKAQTAAQQRKAESKAPDLTALASAFELMRASVTDQLQIMAAGIDATDTALTPLTEAVARLEQQNVVMNGRISRVIALLEALAESSAKPGEPPSLPVLQPTFAPAPAPAPVPTAPENSPKPRILVIGLLPSQSHEIQREFGDSFDMTFIDIDSLKRRHNSINVERYDVVVAMTKFVSHTVEEIKGRAKRLERVNGGVSSLKTKLTQLFVELSEKVAA